MLLLGIVFIVLLFGILLMGGVEGLKFNFIYVVDLWCIFNNFIFWLFVISILIVVVFRLLLFVFFDCWILIVCIFFFVVILFIF